MGWRRAWLLFALAGLAVLGGIFAVSWWAFGRDSAAAAATIAAVPLAVASSALPPAWKRYRHPRDDADQGLNIDPARSIERKASGRPELFLSVITRETEFHYEAARSSGLLTIMPRDPHLDTVRGGGELRPRHFWNSPWEDSFEWPTLDVKMINNSTQALLVHEAILTVSESKPDVRPVPYIAGISYSRSLPLLNVGWGPMVDPALKFFLAAGNEEPVTREFEWNFANLNEVQQADSLSAFFAEAGMDAAGPAYQESSWGPFTQGYAVLKGTLEYGQIDLDGSTARHTNPFISYVSFMAPGMGAPLPPSWTYHVKLRTDDANYTVSVPLSQVVAPGEADRFLLKVAADRSSLHSFTLTLNCSDSITLESCRINLELFVSRLDSERIFGEEHSHPYPIMTHVDPTNDVLGAVYEAAYEAGWSMIQKNRKRKDRQASRQWWDNVNRAKPDLPSETKGQLLRASGLPSELLMDEHVWRTACEAFWAAVEDSY